MDVIEKMCCLIEKNPEASPENLCNLWQDQFGNLDEKTGAVR